MSKKAPPASHPWKRSFKANIAATHKKENATLTEQLVRCRELLKQYDAMGSFGAFGAAATRRSIADAEAAQAAGDLEAMKRAIEDLKGCD